MMKRFFLIGLAAVVLLFMNPSTWVRADENDIKITGEVIDMYCYVTMGAKGEGHRKCGLACAKKGIPIGILENGTGQVYVLLPNKDKTRLPNNVIDKMGKTTTITGHKYTTMGCQFLTIESVE